MRSHLAVVPRMTTLHSIRRDFVNLPYHPPTRRCTSADASGELVFGTPARQRPFGMHKK